VLPVSRHWKSVAEEPALWTDFELPGKCREEINFVKFFQGSLSLKLQKLSLGRLNFQLNNKHIKILLDLQLSSLSIGSIDLSNVSAEIFAKLVNNCKECNIEGNNEMDQKLRSLFEQMETGTKLKSLTLFWSESDELDLNFIDSSTLINALSKLETLWLGSVKLGAGFNQACSVKMKSLYLWECDPFSDMDMLDAVLDNLTSLKFYGTYLDATQVRHLVNAFDQSCRLKIKLLDLSGIDLRKVPAKLLARVLVKIENVILLFTEIEVTQLEEIFHAILDEDTTVIRFLDLDGIQILDEVDPNLFARAVNKLESFSFVGNTALTQNQIKEVFKVMSKETNLRLFGEEHSYFSSITIERIPHIQTIDPEILAEALYKLEEVNLDFDSKLTPAQYKAIFRKLCNSVKHKLV
jgi:hypothetical protein